MGKPSLYTEEIAQAIVDRVSTGETLTSICADEGMPKVRTISDWRKQHPEFAERFAQARLDGFDAIADQALKISDTPLGGLVEDWEEVEVEVDPEPGAVPDGKPRPKRRELRLVRKRKEDMLGHRKLQVETRLKLLAVWDAARYGNKVQTEHSGEIVVQRKVFTHEPG